MNDWKIIWTPFKTVALAAVIIGVLAGPALAQVEAEAETPDTDSLGAPVRRGDSDSFEIHVQGADLRGVLQLLSTQGRRNIVATKEVSGSVTADLYDVTFEEALEAVLRSTGFKHQIKGNFVYVYTKGQHEAILKEERQRIMRVFHLSFITAKDAEAMIQPVLSDEGEVALTPSAETGIGTSDSDAGGNNFATVDILIVKDYKENIEEIEEILRILDVKPDQVLIEATILRATLAENNDLGIDFNALGGVDFSDFAATTDRVTDIATTAAPIRTPQFGVDTAFSGAVPAGGLTLGFISSHVSLFIRALESVTDTTVLANPKLLVMNKQRGEIMIGNREGYNTTTITETIATQNVEFLETGTKLIVRPFIAKNGYIRMEIHPEDSSGSVSLVGTSALPKQTTTEVTSNVLIKDGHTIVIGGLFRELTKNGRAQVPILGNIPYLGTMWRSTADETKREEVIFLITPHIIQQLDDELTSEEIGNEMERFRVGQRKGLRWWGRSRLAQTHMRWARRELAAGNIDKTLWNLDMALSMQPRLVDAIQMKERLTNKVYWADQERVSAAKYIIQQMVMQELGKPVERIISIGKPRDAKNVEPAVREAFGIGEQFEDPLPVGSPVQKIPVENLAPAEKPEAEKSSCVKSASKAKENSTCVKPAPEAKEESTFVKPAPEAKEESTFVKPVFEAEEESTFVKPAPEAEEESTFVKTAPTDKTDTSSDGDEVVEVAVEESND